jgi:hypothetical protein
VSALDAFRDPPKLRQGQAITVQYAWTGYGDGIVRRTRSPEGDTYSHLALDGAEIEALRNWHPSQGGEPEMLAIADWTPIDARQATRLLEST